MQKMQKWQVFTILTENHEKWKKVRKIEEIENFHFPPHFGWIGAAACGRYRYGQPPGWGCGCLGFVISRSTPTETFQNEPFLRNAFL